MKLKKLFVGLFLVTAVAIGCASVVEEALASSTAVVIVKESNSYSTEVRTVSFNSYNKINCKTIRKFFFNFTHFPEFSPVKSSPPRASP